MIVKTLDNLTLEELTETYLCSKYGKDPIKCLDCEKHDSCPAGKRAIELLDQMTEGGKLSKWEKIAMAKRLKARKRAIEVLKHKDPIRYLTEEEGLKLSAARERIRKYKITYPDLFSEKEINATRSSSEIKEAQRKADYKEATASGSPVTYYMKKYGLKYDSAWHRWKDAQIKFEKEEENAMTKNDGENSEEISLNDFLDMHSASEVTDESIETKIESKDELEPKSKMNASVDSIRAKYEELIREREELLAKVDRCNDIIRSFETVMDILYDE